LTIASVATGVGPANFPPSMAHPISVLVTLSGKFLTNGVGFPAGHSACDPIEDLRKAGRIGNRQQVARVDTDN
jgi:hypothetical protein